MKNITLGLNELRAGMVTAAPVLNHTQQIILQQNTKLTSHIVNLLHKHNVHSICVKLEESKAQIEANAFFENTISCFDFDKRYYQATFKAKEIFQYMRKNEQVPYDAFYKLSYESLYELTCEKNALTYIYQLKPPVDYIHIHAIDVGIISGIIGKWCHMEKQHIQMLILAGVMHDIGKSQIPYSILEKPAMLTSEEMNMLKLHPIYGYYMVQGIPGIAPEIGQAILQHHERENGCGYPNNSAGYQIHPFAKIIGIADVYDAMTSNRVYKKSVTPFVALDTLSKEIVTQFNRKYCEVFIKNTLKLLMDATVLLSDHSHAKVRGFSTFLSVNPIVQKKDGQLLDINKYNTSFIEEIIKFA